MKNAKVRRDRRVSVPCFRGIFFMDKKGGNQNEKWFPSPALGASFLYSIVREIRKVVVVSVPCFRGIFFIRKVVIIMTKTEISFRPLL